MFHSTPSTKEHTMKRYAITIVAVALAALSMSAIASAKTSPALVHGASFSHAAKTPAMRGRKAHLSHAPAAKLTRLGHHHLAV
jgi:hypothetical protein